jgi:hypothetical protein
MDSKVKKDMAKVVVTSKENNQGQRKDAIQAKQDGWQP